MDTNAHTASLRTQLLIHADVVRVFEAWTQPQHLQNWWGPKGVRCIGAEVDLREGGRYRIGNRLPDGAVLWIVGEFELVQAPQRLVYSWRLDPASEPPERVTVTFDPRGNATLVSVLHERIATVPLRGMHEKGWEVCLAGLAQYLESSATSAE